MTVSRVYSNSKKCFLPAKKKRNQKKNVWVFFFYKKEELGKKLLYAMNHRNSLEKLIASRTKVTRTQKLLARNLFLNF